MKLNQALSRKFGIWLSIIVFLGTTGFVSDVAVDYFEISKNLDIFGRLYREVNAVYVEETDPEALMRIGIDAMLESLDPYTTFISEEEAEEVAFMSTGQYGGIGAVVRKRDGEMVVTSCYKGYPADLSGLKPGDRILQVDDKRIDGERMTIADLRKMLRGNQGESVRIQIRRPGASAPQDLTLVRGRIKVENVPFYGMVNDQIGFIALAGFTQGASREVQAAYLDLKEQYPQMNGLMLDLRGNPGGRLDEAVKIANLFVSQESLIVETRGRKEENRRRHYAQRVPMDAQMPLVVLVNERSASASEIVAGAIQDLDRGLIVGQRSFGKGLVQNIRRLSYNTQLKVTTARYYTPSGRCIQALDYSDRNEAGQAREIPDSLRLTFLTANGRSVRDGGGIEPDEKVAPLTEDKLVRALATQGLIFDFATEFVQAHGEIPAPRAFYISDEIFQAFVDYTVAEDFTYQTETDKELEEFKEVIENEAYADALGPKLQALANQLEQIKDKNILKHRKEIEALLRSEIVSRYYYQAGERELGLDQDKEVAVAAELLAASERYQNLLGRP